GFWRSLQRPEPAEHRARRESAREAVDALKHPALPRPPEPDRLRCGAEHERHGRDRRDDPEDLEERRAVLETRDAGDVRSEHRDDDEEQEVLHERSRDAPRTCLADHDVAHRTARGIRGDVGAIRVRATKTAIWERVDPGGGHVAPKRVEEMGLRREPAMLARMKGKHGPGEHRDRETRRARDENRQPKFVHICEDDADERSSQEKRAPRRELPPRRSLNARDSRALQIFVPFPDETMQYI